MAPKVIIDRGLGTKKPPAPPAPKQTSTAPSAAKPTVSADTAEAKLRVASKPTKPSTPAGTGMHWEYDSKTNKWVKTKNKSSAVNNVGGLPPMGGPSFEFGGLPSLDFSNIQIPADTGLSNLPDITTGPSTGSTVTPPVDTGDANRRAEAERLAREGLSASSAAILAGISGQDLADIMAQERSGNFELANAMQEAALGRRQAQIASRAEQNKAAYDAALNRQRAVAGLAAQGFTGPGGVTQFQRLVAERQAGQEMSATEARLAAALSAFERMKQQAQARRDAAQANLLSRINPVASFTRGNA